jgi:hypothetical protein
VAFQAILITQKNSGQISDLVLPPSDLVEITAKYNTVANSDTTPAWTDTSVTEVAKKFYPLVDNPVPAFTNHDVGDLRGTLAFLVGQNEVKNFNIADWQTPVGG